jgi:aerobic-type carbon monoxide dehydrogenase small subunit (CoxS/CutS family)
MLAEEIPHLLKIWLDDQKYQCSLVSKAIILTASKDLYDNDRQPSLSTYHDLIHSTAEQICTP